VKRFSTSLWGTLAGLSLAVAAGGCCCHEPRGPGYGQCFNYFGAPMCFGYYSTCWRAWPEECASCPPYTLNQQQAAEAVAPPTGAMPGEGALPPGGPVPPVVPAEPGPDGTIPEGTIPPAAPLPSGAPMPPLPMPPLPGEARLPPVHRNAPFGESETSSRRHWVEAEFASRPFRSALPESR
jgi:hypothetical protein